MKKRQGFFLLWAIVVTAIVSSTAVTIFTVMSWVTRTEHSAEEQTDALLLAQEVLEVTKYNFVYGANEFCPLGITERNGRRYDVSLQQRECVVVNENMTEWVCEVKTPSGYSFSLTTYVGVNQ